MKVVHDDRREEELQKLCKSVVTDPIDYDEGGDRASYWQCSHCYARSKISRKDVKHETDCAYLIAKDLMV